ncbi:unnamed protein product [Spirodela intermedia]|uniref:PROP1-like PPR domain-containing protein n=1 Tax=Spirodela intermedia TaxID=51605 RepID=A0A7I8J9J0_SPIIN|nr:unnamed protein product [Spirodela intermedia]CAA6666113.1 unnamed protein product [Spirodela intermedia]
MEVFALSPPVPVFPSRHSSLSVAATTSLPAGARKNQRVIRVPASSGTDRYHISGSGASRSSQSSSLDVTKTDGKRNPATPVNSSRQDAVAEVIQSPDWVSALSRLETKLQVQDLNIILRFFGKSKRWQDVSQLFNWMQEREMTNIASYSSFMKYMGESRNLIRALHVYSSIEDESTRNNVSICNSLLGCMLKDRKFESCIKMFNQMKENGLVPDLFTYSILLAGCAKVEHGYSQALELVEELESRGLHMDNVIYGTLLAICASHNLCEEAERFFQQMNAEGLSPNLFHYSSLLNAYSVDGDHKKADEIVKSMKSAGLVPNKVILTTLLKVYVRGGLLERSRELLIDLENLGYAEDEIPFCLVMDNLAKKGDVREAKICLNLCLHVAADGYSYSIMISAFCRNGQLKEAKELAREYETIYDKYDLVMLNTLLRAYCNAGEMENVMQMLRKMDALKISPDWNTFQILVKYFLKEKLYHLAYQTVEDMHSKGHQVGEELCSSLILELGKSGAPSEAFSVYNMLRYSKTTPRKSIHEKMLNILIGAKLFKNAYVVMKDNAEDISAPSLDKFAFSFMQAGNINMINDVVKALHRCGRKIDEEVLHIAISRYIARPEKEELLLHLLKWMPGQGYTLNSSSRDLLLKNSHLFGQRQLIAEILAQRNQG